MNGLKAQSDPIKIFQVVVAAALLVVSTADILLTIVLAEPVFGVDSLFVASKCEESM